MGIRKNRPNGHITKKFRIQQQQRNNFQKFYIFNRLQFNKKIDIMHKKYMCFNGYEKKKNQFSP